MKTVDTVLLRMEKSQLEHRYMFYSSKRNEIALVRRIEVWLDKGNKEYFSYKGKRTLWGATMEKKKFMKIYNEYLGDIGFSERIKEIDEILEKL